MTQTNPSLIKLEEYYLKEQETILNDYMTFLKFQSISTEKEYKQELLNCVAWLKNLIGRIGLETTLWETSGHPILFAQDLSAGPNKPTLLIYNHYDVQPVDPIHLWDNPPFEPTLKDGKIYARGAQDNKGQCMYTLHALKALKACFGALPINIKWIIEGEEEAGSKSLTAILQEKRAAFKADYLVICDSGIPDENTPAVTLGARGIIAMDIDVTGSNSDLHSGTHGGRAYNPLHALVAILAQLRDEEGRIRVPGFYDAVKDLSPEEKKFFSFDADEKAYEQTFGIQSTGGEKAYLPLERSTIRPTIEINGISGGYTGEGFKTVIPAKAHAKLSCRLVPDQDPQTIASAVRTYLLQCAPKGVQVTVNLHEGGGEAVRADIHSAVTQAFAAAYSEVFHRPCQYLLIGGSVPVTGPLKRACQGEMLLMGLGLDSDRIHAPNEHFNLERFRKGFLVMARAIQGL